MTANNNGNNLKESSTTQSVVETIINPQFGGTQLPGGGFDFKNEIQMLKLDEPSSVGRAYRIRSAIISAFHPGWHGVKPFDIVVLVNKELVEEPKEEPRFSASVVVKTKLYFTTPEGDLIPMPEEKKKEPEQLRMTVKYTFYHPELRKHMYMHASNGIGMSDLGESLSLIQI